MNYNIDQSQNANLQNYRFEMLNKRKNSRSVSKIVQGNPDNWKQKTRLISKNYATKLANFEKLKTKAAKFGEKKKRKKLNSAKRNEISLKQLKCATMFQHINLNKKENSYLG